MNKVSSFKAFENMQRAMGHLIRMHANPEERLAGALREYSNAKDYIDDAKGKEFVTKIDSYIDMTKEDKEIGIYGRNANEMTQDERIAVADLIFQLYNHIFKSSY